MLVDVAKLTPNDFSNKRPFSSVCNKAEIEFHAQRMMQCQAETGAVWHEIQWDHYNSYCKLRALDVCSKQTFDYLRKYVSSVVGAVAFSPTWARVAGIG